MSQLLAIVLAAGKSRRMKSDRPKVLHQICGKPLVAYVLDAIRAAGATRILVVVGFGADEVRHALKDQRDVEFVDQPEQLGTGHAVEMCRGKVGRHSGPIAVLAGDMPLIRGETLRKLVDAQRTELAACALGTATLDKPHGFGRVLRDERGEFLGIVEQRDANDSERSVREVNLSFYVFHGPALLDALLKLRPTNAQQEFYLTDCTSILRSQGRRVVALPVIPLDEAVGVNSRAELALAAAAMQRRIHDQWMTAGVTLVDPTTTWIDAGATIGADTVIEPFCSIGPVRIGERCRIGPHAFIDVGCEVQDAAVVGSFVHLRQCRVAAGAQTGSVVHLCDAVVDLESRRDADSTGTAQAAAGSNSRPRRPSRPSSRRPSARRR